MSMVAQFMHRRRNCRHPVSSVCLLWLTLTTIFPPERYENVEFTLWMQPKKNKKKKMRRRIGHECIDVGFLVQSFGKHHLHGGNAMNELIRFWKFHFPIRPFHFYERNTKQSSNITVVQHSSTTSKWIHLSRHQFNFPFTPWIGFLRMNCNAHSHTNTTICRAVLCDAKRWTRTIRVHFATC